MTGKAVISLTTGLEDPEKVTVAFLVAVGAAESGRPTLMFQAKEAVRLALDGVAAGVACDGCPPLADLLRRHQQAGGPIPGVPGLLQRQATRQGHPAARRRTGRDRPALGVDRRRAGHHVQLLAAGAARRLREAGRWTPILMLTAMDDDLDHAEGLDSGADDYLPKPFSYPVLLAHLRSLTRRTLGARPAVLSAAGLALDPAGRTATRDGVPLDLTSREVAVLEYLLRHKGHVVSKTELLEHCWDVNFDGEPAVVEVLMHRLRRKIERPGRPAVIGTVRGEGYVIRDDAT